MRLLQTLALSLALTTLAYAQDPKAADATNTLSVDAKLVVAPAIVRNKSGKLLNDLTQADFTLQVDGKPQTIRYFDHDTDVPLTLGLLVDTSRSQASVLDQERDASTTFLDKMLTAPATPNRSPDKAFLVQFASQVALLEDVTDNKTRLEHALKKLETASASPSFQPTADTGDTTRPHGGTTLYDAVFLSTGEITAKQKDRRALILLTDGVDRNSKESLDSAIEASQRSDTIIYAIYYKGDDHHDSMPGNNGNSRHGGGFPGGGGGGWPGGGGGGYPGGGSNPNGSGQGGGNNHPTGADHTPYVDGKKVLDRLCAETGGRVFEVSKHEPVDTIYEEIAEELHSQYRLGFTPTGDAAKPGYREIDLIPAGSIAKSKPTIQTRDGYYAGK